MKRNFIIILLVVLIGAVAGAAYLYFSPLKVSMEELVPQGALSYVRLSHTTENLNKFTSTSLWQSLSQLDYKKIMNHMNASAKSISSVDAFIATINDPQTQDILKKFLGQEISLALYPTALKDESKKMMEDVLSGFVFMTRLTKEVQTSEVVLRLWGKQEGLTKSSYKGMTVYSVKVEPFEHPFCFVRIRDVLVLSLGDSRIHDAIDVYRRSQKSLLKDHGLTAFKDKLKMNEDLVGYLHTAEIVDFVNEQLGPFLGRNDLTRKQWQQALLGETGLKTIGINGNFENLAKIRFLFSFSKEDMNQDRLDNLTQCRARDNQTLKFAPKDSLYYQWNACFNLLDTWHQITDEFNKTDKASHKIDNVEAMLGLSFEDDVIPSFGDEIGGFLSGMDLSGGYPLPQVVLFIKAKDKNSLDRLIKNIVEKTGMALQSEEYAGNTLQFLSTGIGDKVEPSVTYINDYLLLAINRKTIKETLDVSQGVKEALSANTDFQSLDPSLTEPNTGLQVTNTNVLIDFFVQLADWGKQFVNKEDDRKLAFQSGSELRLKEQEAKKQAAQKAVDALSADIQAIEQSISNPSIVPSDQLSLKQKEIQDKRTNLELINKDIVATDEKIADLKKLMEEYDRAADRTKQRQLLLTEALIPVLKAFKNFEYFAQKSNVDGLLMNVDVYLKVR